MGLASDLMEFAGSHLGGAPHVYLVAVALPVHTVLMSSVINSFPGYILASKNLNKIPQKLTSGVPLFQNFDRLITTS